MVERSLDVRKVHRFEPCTAHQIKKRGVQFPQRAQFNKKFMWKNLSPTIYRKRLIIECKLNTKITDKTVDEYLIELSKLLKMTLVAGPLTRNNPRYGISSYIYWEESGTHFYYWNKPFPFLSIDIYSCKSFSSEEAVEFTHKYFNATELVFKEIQV